MQTSYFGNPAIKNNPRAVSIARWPPRWWGLRRKYIALAPSVDLLKRSEAGLSWPEYIAEYRDTVLDKLDPVAVYTILGYDAILLCWEAPFLDCHRRLVAAWIEDALDIEVPEL